jgi:hypothetical protein
MKTMSQRGLAPAWTRLLFAGSCTFPTYRPEADGTIAWDTTTAFSGWIGLHRCGNAPGSEEYPEEGR